MINIAVEDKEIIANWKNHVLLMKGFIMKYLLMNGNIKTLSFDLEELEIKVLNNEYLPYALKDYMLDSDFSSKEKIIRSNKQRDFLRDYLANRVLSLSRTNAKAILGSGNFLQTEQLDKKVKITLECNGLSITDNIWVKKETDDRTFEELNLRNHKLKDAAYRIAILGEKISINHDILAPEFTAKGMFAKTWVRNDNGIELWKTDTLNDNGFTRAEIEASRLLDYTNVSHVKYETFEKDNLIIAKSSCITSDEISMIDAIEMQDYCTHHNTTLIEFMECNYLEDMSKMIVMDYLLHNTDRHLGNISFLINNKNNKLIGMAPLYDHNQSLIAYDLGRYKEDLIYDLTNKSMEESAIEYYDYANLKIDIKMFRPEIQSRYYSLLEKVKSKEDVSIIRKTINE